VRILTYNIYGMQGYPAEAAQVDLGQHGGETHVSHFASTLAALDIDVIALQEGVTQPIARGLAQRLNMHLATFPSPTAYPGHVLSRWPIIESRTFSHVDPQEPVPLFSRTAGAALLQGPHGEQLWIVDLHLHPGDVEIRAREGDLLRSRLERLLAECPHAVVLGDFNSAVEEPGVHSHLESLKFTNAMTAVGGGLQLTMDTAGINEWIIDHIYVSPNLTTHLVDAQVIRDEGFRTDAPRPEGRWDASDHLPVRATLQWP
jgi:endonuclease/exonuclease/phosphatase family metal-dependent hydrolase